MMMILRGVWVRLCRVCVCVCAIRNKTNLVFPIAHWRVSSSQSVIQAIGPVTNSVKPMWMVYARGGQTAAREPHAAL